MKNKLSWIKTSLAKVTVVAMMLLLTGTTTWGAQLADWNFFGYSAYGSSPQSPTVNNANVTVGGLTRGSGIGTSGTAGANAWGGSGSSALPTDKTTALTANSYVTFTVKANTGYKISLYDIPAYNVRHTGSGMVTGIWQYSTDGSTFTDIGSAIIWGSTTTSAGNAEPAIDLSGISALQNVASSTTITFRVVLWGNTATSGTWYFNEPTTGTTDLIVEGGVSSATTGSFTAGNLAVLQADTASLNNTPLSIIELTPSTANQTPAQIISINGSSSGSGVLRNSGSAATAAGLADSSDGTLLAFTGGNAVSGAANANTITARSVVSMNKNGISSYTVAANYTETASGQMRYATTPNNSTWYIGDQNGVYFNGNSSPPAGVVNVRSMRSFGGVVYELTAAFNPIICSVAANGTTNGLAGLGADANGPVDFYMVSSGNNGIYDTLYVLDMTSATVGAINKFSLVSGSWTANGSYATSFGGAAICAAPPQSGSGAVLYVASGDGKTAANQVIKLTDSAGFNSTISVGASTTLYTAGSAAILKGIAFAPTTYSVTYNDNGKTSGSVPTDNTGYGLYATVTVAANSGSLAKTGYTFAGWNTQSDGNGTTYTAGSGQFTINANTTLYAKWTTSTFTVTYSANGGTGSQSDSSSPYNSSATVTVLGTGSITRPGYTFAGWNTQAGGGGTSYNPADTFTIVANTTLYAQWTANGYTVNYDANSGTGSQVDNNNPYTAGTTVTVLGTGTIARTGYTFTGWNTQAGGGGTAYSPSDTFTMPAASVTLYAQWTINSYTLTYAGNGNDGGSAPSAVTQNYNTTTTVSDAGTLSKTGYTFAGWNTAANGSGTAYAASSTFTFTGNTALYAQWTINTYMVTYNANGGTGSQSDPSSPYNYNSTVTVLGAGSIARTGYTFAGWNTAANGSGTAYAASATFTIAANTTLYAQWTINTYTVTYDANGGTGTQSDPNSPYNYKTTVTVLGLGGISRNGNYTFAGWNTAANGSGTPYAVSDTFTIAANKTLYAQWKTPFTPGNLVVYRIGDGSATLATVATAAFLDEYTTSGAYVQTIALPTTAASSGNRALTASGSATSEGQISLSTDGQYISCVGYNAAPGTTGIASTKNDGTGTPDIARVIGRIDNSGNVDSTTALVGATGAPIYTANNIRDAVISGSSYYSCGAAAPYIGVSSYGGTIAPTITSLTTSTRGINIFGGDIYFTTSTTFQRISGTPGAGSAAPTSLLTGLTTASDFVMLDVGNSGTINTCYLVDGPSLKKYSVSGSTLTAEGTATITGSSSSLSGLTATVSGSSVTLYISSPGKIETLTDASGVSGTLSGTATALTLSGSPVIIGTKAAFRGIAFAPKVAPTFNLSASANPSGYKDSLTFTANGFAADVTGTVQFTTNGVNLGSAVTISGQSAGSIAITNLPRGDNAITAIYSGDANYASATKTLTQTVTNHPPSASVQYLTLVSNTVLTVSAATLAGLSYDADGDSLTITAVSSTSTNGGTVTLSGGNISYTPVQDYVGADQFTYTIDDGMGGTSLGTAKIAVRSANPTFGYTYIHSPASGTVNLRAYGIPGHSYDVQKSSDSTFPPGSTTILNGTPLQAAPNGVILYTDNNATDPQGFYRFVVH